MKNYAKIGGRKGKPAYRTPSTFQGKIIFKRNVNQSKIKLIKGFKQRNKIFEVVSF